jgi:hypothetical protein
LCPIYSGFFGRAAPLHGPKKKGDHFHWREEHQEIFDDLKQALCEAPVLQARFF